MFRTLSAFGLSAALALASIAPAQAGSTEENIGKIITGIAIGAVVGAAIKSVQGGTTSGGTAPASTQGANAGRGGSMGNGWGAPLPGVCRLDLNTRWGTSTYYGARCMQDMYPQPQRLPEWCKMDLPWHIGHGRTREREGYDANCLSQAGFRAAPGNSGHREGHRDDDDHDGRRRH